VIAIPQVLPSFHKLKVELNSFWVETEGKREIGEVDAKARRRCRQGADWPTIKLARTCGEEKEARVTVGADVGRGKWGRGDLGSAKTRGRCNLPRAIEKGRPRISIVVTAQKGGRGAPERGGSERGQVESKQPEHEYRRGGGPEPRLDGLGFPREKKEVQDLGNRGHRPWEQEQSTARVTFDLSDHKSEKGMEPNRGTAIAAFKTISRGEQLRT